jgi:hypothetical protein
MSKRIGEKMKKLYLLVLLFCACTSNQINPTPTPVTPIKDVTTGTSCAKNYWSDRGVAKIGYIKGMAASYARSLCKNTVAKKPISDVKDKEGRYLDVLKHYELKSGNEFRNTYTILLGLGMRESSGNYTEGLDASSDQPWKAETTEAGLWQFSYNANKLHPELQQIWDYYKTHQNECLLEVYKEGMTKFKTEGYVGTGPGREFQEFFRSCPAAQAEYAAVMIRLLRTHFGPLNRKAAEYIPACEQMFAAIEKEVSCSP